MKQTDEIINLGPKTKELAKYIPLEDLRAYIVAYRITNQSENAGEETREQA